MVIIYFGVLIINVTKILLRPKKKKKKRKKIHVFLLPPPTLILVFTNKVLLPHTVNSQFLVQYNLGKI